MLKESEQQPIGIDLDEELRAKNLMKYRRQALQSALALWNEPGRRKSRRSRKLAVKRGIVTAELLMEYNDE